MSSYLPASFGLYFSFYSFRMLRTKPRPSRFHSPLAQQQCQHKTRHVSCLSPLHSHVPHNHSPEAAHLSLTAAHQTLPSTSYPFLMCPPELAWNSGLSIPFSLLPRWALPDHWRHSSHRGWSVENSEEGLSHLWTSSRIWLRSTLDPCFAAILAIHHMTGSMRMLLPFSAFSTLPFPGICRWFPNPTFPLLHFLDVSLLTTLPSHRIYFMHLFIHWRAGQIPTFG